MSTRNWILSAGVLGLVAIAGSAAAEQPSLPGALAHFERPDSIPSPAENAHTPERELLGKSLFFDPRLSGSGWISCASCHNPTLSYGDGLALGIGDGMETLGRRTPTVLNLAWSTSMFWDGRAASLEEQALGPIQAEGEMNLSLEELESRILDIPAYAPLFEAAYPGEAIDREQIARAIAVFERTLVSGEAPFDRWVKGDEDALSPQAKHGFEVFMDSGCATCHSGWRLSDDGFYDIGVAGEDPGRGAIIPVSSVQYAFKTPTLREVSRRGPYMHDGSLETLEEVVDFYDRGGDAGRPNQSEHVKPLGLSADEKAALVSFMESLTGPAPQIQLPELPR